MQIKIVQLQYLGEESNGKEQAQCVFFFKTTSTSRDKFKEQVGLLLFKYDNNVKYLIEICNCFWYLHNKQIDINKSN